MNGIKRYGKLICSPYTAQKNKQGSLEACYTKACYTVLGGRLTPLEIYTAWNEAGLVMH